MAEIDLTQADDGRTVPVHVGDRVVLTLPENATTGVRWTLPESDAVELLGDDNVAAGAGIGAGGMRVLTLRPTRRGTIALQLRRCQAWDPETTEDARFAVKLDAR
ncbi:MAG: hypothetical protein Kow00114_34970 [Kiloniellaceae bacterium]